MILTQFCNNLSAQDYPDDARQVTIGDLKRDGKLLELMCGNCHRHLYEDPAKSPSRDAEPVPTLARRLRCKARRPEYRSLVSDLPPAQCRPPAMGAS